MSICAVFLIKNEADIVATLLHHYLGQVDELLVRDNVSSDGTTDIVAAIASEHPEVTHIIDTDPAHYQGRKMTELAMMALDRGHRWVIPLDGDEFWYAPEGRPLRDWFDATGREQQFVKGAIYNYVCTSNDDLSDPDPVRRIRWRQRVPLDMRWGKVACRLRPDLVIDNGHHSARTEGTGTMGFGPLIRHYPYRSPEQFVSKAVTCYEGLVAATDESEGTGAHCRAYGRAIEEGGVEVGHAWFHDAFWSPDPEKDESLVYDPVRT